MAVRLKGFSDDFDTGGAASGLRLEDPFYQSRHRRARQKHALSMLPSDWVNRFVRIKDGNTGRVKQLDFEERKYLLRPYNTSARNVLFVTSRQSEKSTTLGNKLFAMCGMRPMYETLFVSPSAMQTTVFSRTRIDDIVDISPLLKAMVTYGYTWNILEKVWANRSRIYLRYAFLSADRIRGLAVNAVFCDELQDLVSESMPVIEETASHHKDPVYVYSGTPKTLDNTIENYWAKSSTMSEWVIPCTKHGLPNTPSSWHWNILGLKNLGKKGPICERCGGALNPEHPYARWVETNPGDPSDSDTAPAFEGYRICRLMVPWFWKDPAKWKTILNVYERYPTAQFMNEVLAISYDSGTKPITRAEVIRACDPEYLNDLAQVEEIGRTHPLYFGIDWGCHDEETRVLTEDRGFVHFRDLTGGDKVAQWDPDTREMTFIIPKVCTVREWNQPLLHFKTRGGVDQMLTHTHRMRVAGRKCRKWVTEAAGETIERRQEIKFVGYVDWVGNEAEEFELPPQPTSLGYPGAKKRSFNMDLWLEFMGYLVTEGGICFNKGKTGNRLPSCIKMSQRETVNPKTAAKIKKCMDTLGVPYSEFPNPKTGDLNWTICGKQYWTWYRDAFGSTSSTKRLPRWVFKLSKRQLQILFEAMIDGDGHRDPRENCTSGSYYSTSRGLCEDFQELAIRLGLRCHVRLHKPAAGNRRERYRACFSKGRDHVIGKPHETERIPYSGKVYCCSVPSGYIVTERNGCVAYQGNTGDRAYTVLTISAYCRNNEALQIIYMKRFEGPEADADQQVIIVEKFIQDFAPKYVGADYGMGFYPNKVLTSKFGPKRIHQFQYAARLPMKVAYSGKLHRYMVFRTPVMADIFHAVKRGKIRLPKWEAIREPFASDILSIYSEYSETMKMLKFDKPRNATDDSFHSILYSVLASFLAHPRPDIISPIQESFSARQEFSIYEDLTMLVDPGEESNPPMQR